VNLVAFPRSTVAIRIASVVIVESTQRHADFVTNVHIVALLVFAVVIVVTFVIISKASRGPAHVLARTPGLDIVANTRRAVRVRVAVVQVSEPTGRPAVVAGVYIITSVGGAVGIGRAGGVVGQQRLAPVASTASAVAVAVAVAFVVDGKARYRTADVLAVAGVHIVADSAGTVVVVIAVVVIPVSARRPAVVPRVNIVAHPRVAILIFGARGIIRQPGRAFFGAVAAATLAVRMSVARVAVGEAARGLAQLLVGRRDVIALAIDAISVVAARLEVGQLGSTLVVVAPST